MSARLQTVLRCDNSACIATATFDTQHRTLARRRADEQGWQCDPRGGHDRCPEHRESTS